MLFRTIRDFRPVPKYRRLCRRPFPPPTGQTSRHRCSAVSRCPPTARLRPHLPHPQNFRQQQQLRLISVNRQLLLSPCHWWRRRPKKIVRAGCRWPIIIIIISDPPDNRQPRPPHMPARYSVRQEQRQRQQRCLRFRWMVHIRRRLRRLRCRCRP